MERNAKLIDEIEPRVAARLERALRQSPATEISSASALLSLELKSQNTTRCSQ
jgi:hypothetical protein